MKKIFYILGLCISILCTVGLDFSSASENSDTQKTSSEISNMNDNSQAPKASMETKLDTSHWKTYSVGRHLILMPPSAEIYWYPLRFRGQYDLVWKKDMTIEEAREILAKEAEEAKKLPHQSDESQYGLLLTEYGVNGAGIALMRRPHQFANSYLFKTYFINMDQKDERLNTKENERVFYYEEEVVDVSTLVDDTKDFINEMATAVDRRDPSDTISVAAGMAFDGGLFYGPLSVYPSHEEIAIEVRFPEHPGIVLKLFLDYLNQDGSQMFANAGDPVGNILRQAHTTIDGNPAQELLRKFQENDVTYYSFSLNGASKKTNVYAERIPQITMYLSNPTGGVVRDGISTQRPLPKKSSFASDEEALAFWDAIRESVRWRPDHERGDTPPKRTYYIIDGEIVLGPVYTHYPPKK